MPYKIGSDMREFPGSVEISEAEAGQLRRSMKQLLAGADLEELYDLLVTDYIEFEATTLTSAVEHSAGRLKTDADYDLARRQFNRHLMHLLTLARTYLDSAQGLATEIVQSNLGEAKYKELRDAEHQARFGFRVMRALRNSAQHSGLPLHGFQAGLSWIPHGDKRKGRVHRYVAPLVSVAALVRDKRFDKEALAELRSRGPSFDIRPMVRDYLEGISNIHYELRLFILEEIMGARSVVLDAIEKWHAFTAWPRGVPLYVLNSDEDGQDVADRVLLTLRPYEVCEELEAKNPQLSNLNLSFVSNSVDEFGSMKSDKDEV